MSSPRVRRTVAINPASITICLKVSIAAASERSYSVPGNGLNGMRFSFDGTRRSSLTSARAYSGLSLIPFIKVYSNVTDERGRLTT